MIRKIRLPQGQWTYDDTKRLGVPGGFGEVFLGAGSGGEVAIKRLKLTAEAAAHREMDIARDLFGKTFSHVVPVLDAGQDAESGGYFLVMPVCDGSLQEEINRSGGVPLDKALVASRAIVDGLLEVQTLVHRDLKPANVLKHQGVWKIADFGIAKFVEDSTSLQTLRSSLTPQYAAPEQWRSERPTAATDVYALGCIIYALLTGKPPFSGGVDELRVAHLGASPELLGNAPPRLATFASQMLRKSPEGRPTLSRCRVVFEQGFDLPVSGARSLLAAAARQVESREAEEEADNFKRDAERKARMEHFKEARAQLKEIFDQVRLQIQNETEGAKFDGNGVLRFGQAVFSLSEPAKIEETGGPKLHSNDARNWQILAWSSLFVKTATTGYKWSATLFYGDVKNGEGHRWYEVAFYNPYGTGPDPDDHAPVALRPDEQDFVLAIRSGAHSYSVAYGPLPIDAEDRASFVDRWTRLIARAAVGELSRPRAFPIRHLDDL